MGIRFQRKRYGKNTPSRVVFNRLRISSNKSFPKDRAGGRGDPNLTFRFSGRTNGKLIKVTDDCLIFLSGKSIPPLPIHGSWIGGQGKRVSWYPDEVD